jgi:hypothetical protein
MIEQAFALFLMRYRSPIDWAVTLLDLIIVRRLPFSCVEWPEFHAFIRAVNREAPSFIPIHHSTITDWIHNSFSEAQDIVQRVLQSAKTKIHLAVDI